ncbi:MAG: RNA 2',3'-cyclic phosphodiesterase [Chlorobi bacterium]|nr:RNA 2',3'-cyclic phosphodiesterase [Chlorobiota bacterium]
MGTAARRVFVGIPAGEELVEQVLEFRKRYSDLHVRWIKPENLHLTIIPPWQTDMPENACGALRDTADLFPQSDVLFTTVSPGPVVARPRLLWATGPAAPFFEILRSELIGRLSLAPTEERMFLMHLTIARIKFDDRLDVGWMKLQVPVLWKACLRRLSLYESILKPDGAEYRVLCEALFALNTDH